MIIQQHRLRAVMFYKKSLFNVSHDISEFVVLGDRDEIIQDAQLTLEVLKLYEILYFTFRTKMLITETLTVSKFLVEVKDYIHSLKFHHAIIELFGYKNERYGLPFERMEQLINTGTAKKESANLMKDITDFYDTILDKRTFSEKEGKELKEKTEDMLNVDYIATETLKKAWVLNNSFE
ncbi:hypothetical protein [Bacillus sp. Marseille-Q1617]|uniref:hypothetical protein n=1 Tax=Bacillus sp. Marseille-Q1617 TaxID=2736887 RepID=UPI00158CA846|nr:hypothetical protein [Bacillus sp. Marseille-Q1617]